MKKKQRASVGSERPAASSVYPPSAPNIKRDDGGGKGTREGQKGNIRGKGDIKEGYWERVCVCVCAPPTHPDSVHKGIPLCILYLSLFLSRRLLLPALFLLSLSTSQWKRTPPCSSPSPPAVCSSFLLSISLRMPPSFWSAHPPSLPPSPARTLLPFLPLSQRVELLKWSDVINADMRRCSYTLYIYTHKYIYIHTHIYIYIHIYICVYICIHIYIYGVSHLQRGSLKHLTVFILSDIETSVCRFRIFICGLICWNDYDYWSAHIYFMNLTRPILYSGSATHMEYTRRISTSGGEPGSRPSLHLFLALMTHVCVLDSHVWASPLGLQRIHILIWD